MKKIGKLLLILLLLIPLSLVYNVKADDEILVVESITQIENETDVDFMVINNYEVAAIYEDLGDTLEFAVKVKNVNNRKNVILKDLTILTDSEGVDYTATMDREDLELEPNETRIIKVKGILNNKAFNSEKIIKVQLHYNVSDRPCPDCDKPLPVNVNPKTGDKINYSFIILGASIVGIIIIFVIFIFIKKKNKKEIEKDDTKNNKKSKSNKKSLLLLLTILLNIFLIPSYNVKADSDYVLEIIIHQKIKINKIDDTITIDEVTKIYDGDPTDGDFTSESGSPITPIYYDDELCQNPIEGKPKNAGIYYATATSEGNTWYKAGELACTRAVTIEKDNITIKAKNQTKVYDGTPLVADSTCEIVEEFDEYSVQCTSSGSITDVGETDKEIVSVIITKDDEDITNNYNITPISGTLKVTPSPTATPGTCNTIIYNGLSQELVSGGEFVTYTNNTGINATEYTVTVSAIPNYMFEDEEFTKTITCEIDKREAKIKPNTQDIIYGEEISSTVNDVQVTNLVEGHILTSITLTKEAEPIAPDSEDYEACVIEGEELNSCYKIKSSNAVIDANGNDVTNNYDIKYKKGIVRVHKKVDTITVEEVVETYTGDPIDGDFNNESGTPITPIYYDDDQCQNPIEGKPKNAGVYYATATSDGNDIYKAAELSCSKVVTINKAASVCPVITNVTTTYDEDIHSLDIGDGIKGGVLHFSLDGVSWTENNIEVINAGVYNIYTKVVGDRNHNDQDCGTHTITINQKDITVKSKNQTKVYDGTPLVADNVCTLESGYGEEYTVECVTSGSITDAGETDKVIESVVIKKNGEDVTANYNITPKNGKLTVTLSPTAEVGECSEPVYNGEAQALIDGGTHVSYQDNSGINATDYNIVATSGTNYSFEDGETMKVISCPIIKRNITITPKTQDIQYGEEISKLVTDVDVTNLVEGQVLSSIVLMKETNEVTDDGKITASNAIIKQGETDTTNNYEIEYKKGKVTIYYNSTFISGEHCEATSPGVKKSYNNNVKLNSIEPKTGYSASTWMKDDTNAGFPDQTIIIDGNYTFTSKCIDDIKPTLIDVNVVTDQTDFVINVKTEDLGSGSTKIEWFYKKCGDEVYTKLQDTDFYPTNDVVEKSNRPNVCLKYGTYYVYVKVTDDAGNIATSQEIKVELEEPTTEKVKINGSNVGTTCKTLECSLNELLQYFK